jgi:Anti-sigma-28 factor, FlgM
MQTKGDDVIDAALRVERIKERINRAEYRVDADAVAEAVVRRLCLIPPPSGAGTPAGPARVRLA